MPRLAGVTAALNQGLQVGYNEAQRVQDDPGHDDALQPAGSFFNGSLIAGNHADQQCNGCDCDGNDGADGNDLTVNILSTCVHGPLISCPERKKQGVPSNIPGQA